MEIRPLIYRNVVKDRYLITDSGDIFTTSSRRIHKLIPQYRQGYALVTLAVEKDSVRFNGKYPTKEYRVHRLVKAVFDHDSDMIIDHKDANKLNNHIDNLEYVTSKINSERAVLNGCYRNGENHFKSVLTNDQVRAICKLYSQGVSVRETQRQLHLEHIKNIDKIMVHILYRDNWKSISNDYDWDINLIRYKTYKRNHLENIASLIHIGKMTSREIAKLFPQYDEDKLIKVIKKMRQGKLYVNIMEEAKRSTTIDNIRDGDGFIPLIRKR